MLSQGIFILKTSKEEVIERIDKLCHDYHHRGGDLVIFKRYCRDVMALFESCFMSDTIGYRACYKQLEEYYRSNCFDKNVIEFSAMDIFNTMLKLRNMAQSAFYLKDLPSCRELTELSEEDMVAAAKDLVKSKVVKASIGTMLLTKDVNDAVTIFDVKDFYERLAHEIIGSVSESRESLSPVERILDL